MKKLNSKQLRDSHLVDIHKLKKDIVFTKRLRGHELIFHSTWGLFSPRKIDKGSELLINHVSAKPEDISLDLGCGYGAIGLFLAKLSPQGKVHLIDKDFVAIEYAKKNAKLNNISNAKVYQSNGFSNISETKFDNVLANLPAKTGKEMLYILLNDANKHLKTNGKIYTVTISGLKEFIKRNLVDVFDNYEKLAQSKGYTVSGATKFR